MGSEDLWAEARKRHMEQELKRMEEAGIGPGDPRLKEVKVGGRIWVDELKRAITYEEYENLQKGETVEVTLNDVDPKMMELILGDTLEHLSVSTPSVIGVFGSAGAGKDTLASTLVTLGYERVAFADRLKAVALSCDPWIRRPKANNGYSRLSHIVEMVGWEVAKTAFPEVRKFLQDLGVAVRDNVGQHVWVDAALRSAEGKNIVITDVRFPNEFEAVRAAGGKLVRIDRPDHGVLTADAAKHISETAWRNETPDYVINNNGTLDELAAAATQLAKHIKENS